jgi:hypothetical protein
VEAIIVPALVSLEFLFLFPSSVGSQSCIHIHTQSEPHSYLHTPQLYTYIKPQTEDNEGLVGVLLAHKPGRGAAAAVEFTVSLKK